MQRRMVPVLVALMFSAFASSSLQAAYGRFEFKYATFPVGLMTYTALVTDVTGDGEKDLVLISGNDLMKQPVVVYGIHDHSIPSRFPAWISDSTFFATGSASGDFDGDGLQDIALSSVRGHTIEDKNGGGLEIFHGETVPDGPVHLSCCIDTDITGFQGTDLRAADVDYDGDLDLVVSTWEDNGLVGRVYLNDGGQFKMDRRIDIKGSGATRLLAEDVDGDGRLELVFLGSELSVYDVDSSSRGLNISLKWKVPYAPVSPGGQPRAFGLVAMSSASGRYVAASDQSHLAVYDVAGKQVWSTPTSSVIAALASMDLDRDGNPDLVATEYFHDPVAGEPCYPLGPKCIGGEISTYMGKGAGAFEPRQLLNSDVEDRLQHDTGDRYIVSQKIVPASIYDVPGCTDQSVARGSLQKGTAIFNLPFGLIASIDKVVVNGHPVSPVRSGTNDALAYNHIDGTDWIFFNHLAEVTTPVEVTYTVDESPDIVFPSALPQKGTLVLKNTDTCH